MIRVLSVPRLAWAILLLAGVLSAGAAEAEAEIDFLYGDHELFPSMIVSATSFCAFAPRDPQQLGDPMGVISVRVRSPAAGTKVRVTFEETMLFATSSVEVILPAAGKDYHVAPTVRYHHEKLAGLKQAVANQVVKVTVELAGRTLELYPKIVVHSVNDCMWAYIPRGKENWNFDVRLLGAAYVNENSAVIDRQIIHEALARGYVKEFRGYYGDVAPGRPLTVRPAELKAIYETLRAMGFKYAALSQASVHVPQRATGAGAGVQSLPPGQSAAVRRLNESRVRTSYIRLVGDAMASRQANGLEGAALLASVYRKLQLQTAIILYRKPVSNLPGSLLGVYQVRQDGGKNQQSLLVLDPELIGSESFEKAVEVGTEKYHAALDFLFPATGDIKAKAEAETNGYLWIDIEEARANGVLPIPEVTP